LPPPGAPALNATKLHPPRVRTNAVPRPYLTTMLVEARPRLVLLIAPPGFGKSTLLAEWAERDQRPFAWLRTDQQDNDPTVLWTYLAAAVARSMREDLPTERIRAIARDGAYDTTLAGELEASGGELVIALDEYFHIEDSRSHAALFRFIEQAPPNVSIAIASRVEPPFPLARLRASGDVLELRAADLRFSLDESQWLLNESLGLGLEPQSVRMLHDRTEGWPAGLYLANLGLRNARDRATFVRRFGASNRLVGDYLKEQILAALDEETLRFMLRTSLVDQICGPLADVLTGREDSGERLAKLEQANVFLQPLDDTREWYRYHLLLRELLQIELRRRLPADVPVLHALASAWFEQAGDADRAVNHAIEAGDTDTAGRLIGANYLYRIEWGRIATVESWLRRLGDDVVDADGRLAVVKTWTMHFLGRHDEADLALEAAQRSAPEGPLPDGASSIESTIALVNAAFPGGDVGRMLAGAQRAFELEAARRSPWRVTVHVLVGLALVRAGRFAEAEPYLARGEELAHQARMGMDEVGARALRARVALETGQLELALGRARSAVAVAGQSALGRAHAGALARTVLGETLLAAGRSAEGEAVLAEALPDVRSMREPFVLTEFLLALARARHALGRTADAARLLAEAEGIVETMPDPGDLRRSARETSRRIRRRGIRPGEDLTERELDVLRLVAAGLSTRETAGRLYVSFNTVHTHIRTIYRKLGVGSRGEATARASEMGLIPDVRTHRDKSPG
jgi:LuxR family maltose regulon positive regulatory protein